MPHSATLVAGEPGDRLKEVFENTKELFITNALDKTMASAKVTDKIVHEHPYKSLAVAAGVGLLLGLIMGRRPRAS